MSHQAAAKTPIALMRAVLIDACHLAVDPALPLQDALRLFRSVVALARSVRPRDEQANEPMHRENPDLAARIGVVQAAACRWALVPDVPLQRRIGLHRIIVQLACAMRLAPACAQNNKQKPMHREEAAAPTPAPDPVPMENPIHREIVLKRPRPGGHAAHGRHAQASFNRQRREAVYAQTAHAP